VRIELLSKSCIAFVMAFVVSGSAYAWPHKKQSQKAHVRFLAESTFIRSSWTSNEDTYFAELILPKSDEKILVRLIDAYPDGGDPLSTRVLQSDSGTTFAVRHDAGCDGPFRNLLLRAAPGDIMAIFPVPLSYQPPLTHIPAPDSLLPCYRVSRR
jgi:hypothetical protein